MMDWAVERINQADGPPIHAHSWQNY